MITIDEMGAMLDEIAAEIPAAIYRELNGGILLLPQAKLHDRSVGGDLFILGEYLGPSLALDSASAAPVVGGLSADQIRGTLRDTVKHEFIHHLESMAGERDLEHSDERHLAEYLARKHPMQGNDPTQAE